jgi:hypothetical protein
MPERLNGAKPRIVVGMSGDITRLLVNGKEPGGVIR